MTKEELDRTVNALKDKYSREWKLSPVHGLSHWQRVERNGLLLAQDNPEVNLAVVRLFAYLHDSCRVDDAWDMEHGPRAAKKLEGMRDNELKGLSEHEFNQLQEAIKSHTARRRTGDITIDTCFDADRLDLGRVYIEPDPSKMATERGSHFAAHPEEFNKLCQSWL